MEMHTWTKSRDTLTAAPTNAASILALRQATRADVSRVGAKAANLGELAHTNFPVPDGFVLTTSWVSCRVLSQ